MWIVIGAVALIMAALVFFFAPRGAEAPDEAAGDLTYIEGTTPRRAAESGGLDASVADITAAEVRAEEGERVFEASVSAPPSQPLKTSALELRWDIAGEEGSSFTLTVAVAKESHASLFSGTGYGAGTVDDTFPGTLLIEGDKIAVRVDPGQIEGFPEGFEWSLATTLRAFRKEPDSPRVEDRYPDQGSKEFTP